MSGNTSSELWHDAFPQPQSTVEMISAADLHSLLADAKSGQILVVDVRRTDFEGSFIKGAINLPAHSFYPTLQSLMPILTRYPLVVFHCNNCKPGGRGPRAAGWYQDELNRRGLTESRAAVLEGGIKGWISKYSDDELTSRL
ncbi:Rhodanese-like domain-containing protein [Desarmillaria tabescens]|uniref:Rhodanese-like domain-containing protein n=1 Tax=Armillaria tabescens TaxID=1929756 RepID=A0AA39NP72_ARMTA|nr:Rhodanese-like domain-containing protein [Desarmillaria tabescens]KAK0469236.1 Rhodanese-like domain-containing protein [Desarmillaria tabescens]